MKTLYFVSGWGHNAHTTFGHEPQNFVKRVGASYIVDFEIRSFARVRAHFPVLDLFLFCISVCLFIYLCVLEFLQVEWNLLKIPSIEELEGRVIALASCFILFRGKTICCRQAQYEQR